MPRDLYYSIAGEVFAQFPGYVRGVVLAYDVANGASPSELISLLREAEASVRGRVVPEAVGEHPRIAPWRQAYRAFGANPGKFRCSIEAMVRRVLKDQALPTINALVDIGNVVSLRRLVPVGGHAIDCLREDIALHRATGAEEFVALDSEEIEHPEPGEIIFVEGNTVLTRRWSWRQGKHTLTLPETTAIEMNVDGLPPVPVSEVEAICGELMDLVRRFCGGRMRYEILTPETPRIRLTE